MNKIERNRNEKKMKLDKMKNAKQHLFVGGVRNRKIQRGRVGQWCQYDDASPCGYRLIYDGRGLINGSAYYIYGDKFRNVQDYYNILFSFSLSSSSLSSSSSSLSIVIVVLHLLCRTGIHNCFLHVTDSIINHYRKVYSLSLDYY